MNILTLEDLQNLTSPQEGWCFSIYMPTVDKSQETRQNPIRFKNLMDEAEGQLLQAAMEKPEIRQLFEPLEGLLNDGQFWQHQEAGLAVFLSSSSFQYYQLPMAVDEVVVVNERFYIKPLLPLMHGEEKVYVLSLSLGGVRLLKVTESQIEEMEVPNLPKSMDDALGYDDIAKSYQWRMGAQLEHRSGERRAMFHGHTEDDDNRKEFIANYFRDVDKAVSNFLNKENKTPLILACVEYLRPIYKEANTYEHLSEDFIPGNPDGIKADKLRQEALKLVKPQFQVTKNNDAGQYKLLAGWKDNRAVKDVEEIIKAAPYGRVEVLFVDKNAKRWGSFDENNIEVHFDREQKPGNEDLLDFAAVQTLLHGGTVYADRKSVV